MVLGFYLSIVLILHSACVPDLSGSHATALYLFTLTLPFVLLVRSAEVHSPVASLPTLGCNGRFSRVLAVGFP